MRKVNTVLYLLFAMIFIASCEIQENFEYESSTTPDAGKFEGNALDYIKSDKDLSLLNKAIDLSGLQALFKTDETRTFVCPNDKAFNDYLKQEGYESLEKVPTNVLQDILKYHIAKGYYYTHDPEYIESNKTIEFETESNNPMLFSHNSNFQVLINEGTQQTITVYISNIRPNNGVIHITTKIAEYKP